MKKRLVLLLFVLLSFPLFNAHAQFEASPLDIIDSGIYLRILPEVPGPNQSASARLESSTVDLDQSTIVWRVNGAEIDQGRGVKDITFNTGGIGSVTTVSVTIQASEGTFTRQIRLENNSVDLLWQGEGYVHPFYKGRTLWGRQSMMTLMAIPNIPGSNPANLTYRWSQDGTIVGNASGVGKNSLTIVDSILSKPRTIKVEVMRDRETVAATASVVITPTNPALFVYENNPLLGLVFERAIYGKSLLKEREITFNAFPFYFSTSNRGDQVSYRWHTNAGEIEENNSVTYRTPDGAGESYVGVSANSLSKVLQSAARDFVIQFNNENRF